MRQPTNRKVHAAFIGAMMALTGCQSGTVGQSPSMALGAQQAKVRGHEAAYSIKVAPGDCNGNPFTVFTHNGIDGIKISGSKNTINGDTHSNADVTMSGSKNVIS